MSKYFDMHGFPITYTQWVERFEDDSRIIGKTDIDGIMISTVWLGLRHGTDDFENPYIFETMVFNAIGEEVYVRRYISLREALDGHIETVQKYVINAIRFKMGMFSVDEMLDELDRYMEDGN